MSFFGFQFVNCPANDENYASLSSMMDENLRVSNPHVMAQPHLLCGK